MEPGFHGAPGSAGQGASDGVSASALLGVLRRRKLLVLIPTVLVTAGFAVAAQLLPARYRAEALLLSEPRVPRDQLGSPELDVQNQLARIADVLHRPSLLEQVIRETGLRPAGAHIGEEDLREVEKRITLQVESERMFALGFEDRDPRRVARVASRLADLLVSETGAEREERAETTASFLAQQIESVESRLDEQNRRIEEYRQRWFGEIPEQAPTNLKLLESAQERLQRSSESLLEQRARRAAILRELEELERQGFSKDPGEARLEELRIALRQLRRRYQEEHPDVVKARIELEELERAVAAGTAGSLPAERSDARLRLLQLRAELEGVEERIARGTNEQSELAAQSASYRSRVEAAPRHEMALAAMTREYEDTRTQYLALLEQVNEARLSERLEKTERASVLRVVEPPRVPEKPFAPNRLRLVLMGLAAGLGLGFAAAFVREQSDRTLRDVPEIESATQLPVLATIPSVGRRARGRRNNSQPPEIAALDAPYGAAAEQYRILATRLLQDSARRGSTTVLVTSPMVGDGKTTTAVNLALTLARLVDEAVLLVDADLGRPNVHRLLQLPSGPGIGDLLSGPQGLELERHVRWHHGLHVLVAGRVSPHTRAALGSPRGQKVFEQLRRRFTYVVVDAPPVLAVAETFVLQRLVDSVLVVLRSGVTHREAARRALQSLDPSRLVGFVLSDADAATSYAYSYPYYAEPEERGMAEGPVSA